MGKDSEMNNEPVAWYYPGGSPDQCTTNKEYAEMEPAWTPLYTHPVKELTDEEIYETWFNYGCGIPWTANTKTFARALVRKAQENG